MIEIKVSGVNELMAKIDTFTTQIKELHTSIPQEMKNWQTGDMHRKFASQKTHSFKNRLTVTTKVHPHSVYETKKAAEARRKRKRRKTAPAVRPRSTRPILRPVLLEELHDRMVKLVSEAMKWP
jgi:t-SNARE complex subunit (syntaxin)